MGGEKQHSMCTVCKGVNITTNSAYLLSTAVFDDSKPNQEYCSCGGLAYLRQPCPDVLTNELGNMFKQNMKQWPISCAYKE